MICSSFKIALLIQIVLAIAGVSTQSGCSGYFWYARVLSTNETIGIIKIPSPLGDVDLHLRVEMYVNARLSRDYKGRIQLKPSTQEPIPTVQQERLLQYRVYFPLQEPLPVVYSIMLNNRRLCFTPPASGAEVTLFELLHTYYQPIMMHIPGGVGNIVEPLLPEEDNPPRPSQPTPTWSSPTPPASTWVAPTWPSSTPPASTLPALTWPAPIWPGPTLPPPPQPTSTSIEPLPKGTTGTVFPDLVPENIQDCGWSRSNNHVDQSVVVGKQTSIDQWPWLVAIFVSTSITGFTFQCSGTLLSNSHIITAAHCFHSNKGYLPAGVFHVSLGRNSLRNWRERGSKNRNIARYKLHPDYDPTERNADADLAIIVLSERVEYSARIKPICLWSGKPELISVEGITGFVVGWGEDGNGNKYVQRPRMFREPIVNQEDCLRDYPAFESSTSTKTFCAGSRNGTGPCYNDCGSGLVVYNSVTNRYYLRGVGLVTLRDNVTGSCEENHYSIYVDVAKHLQWVQQQIATEELRLRSRNKAKAIFSNS